VNRWLSILCLVVLAGCQAPVSQQSKYPADNGQAIVWLTTNDVGQVFTNTIHFGP